MGVGGSKRVRSGALRFSPKVGILCKRGRDRETVMRACVGGVFLKSVDRTVCSGAIFTTGLGDPARRSLTQRLRGFVANCRKATSDSVSLKQTVRVLGVSEGNCLIRTSEGRGRARRRERGLLAEVSSVVDSLGSLGKGLSRVGRGRRSLQVRPKSRGNTIVLSREVTRTGTGEGDFTVKVLVSTTTNVFKLVLATVVTSDISMDLVMTIVTTTLIKFYKGRRLGCTERFRGEVQVGGH